MSKTAWVVRPLLAVALSACATTDPNIRYYEPPPGLSQENGATIIGSRVPQSFPLDDQTAYVLGVSGQPVRGGKAGFSEPVVLAPGVHGVAIAWTQGSLFGNTTIQVSVAKGDRLIVKHQRVDEKVARIWLENAQTKTAIGEAVFVHTSDRSGHFVPIFIPIRK